MRRVAALIAVIPLLAACGQTTSGSSASCAGPLLDDQPPGGEHGGPAPTVPAGDQVTIYGHWFTSTCNDTNHDEQPLQPLAPVQLALTLPGGTLIQLGVLTPGGADMGFSTTVHIPAETPAGSATVTDNNSHTFRFSISR